MNIFVLGLTKTGKTTIAGRVAKKLSYELVSGSTWVKSRYVPPPGVVVGSPDYLRDITNYSCSQLASNPNVCVDYIHAHHCVEEGFLVIEGLRNPRDFTLLFRPDEDLLILLNYPNNPIVPSDFERHGVRVIRDTVEWMTSTGILDPSRVLKINLGGLHGDVDPPANDRYETPMPIACRNLDEAIENVLGWVGKASPMPRKSSTHREYVCPNNVWVDNRVLQDMDPEAKGWTKGRIFAVNSYKGHSLTFEVLLGTGAVFSYVPAHMIRWMEPGSEESVDLLEEKDLTYALCPEGRISVDSYNLLTGEKAKAFFVRQNRWVQALYLFTVDWVDDNLLLHAMALENGQVALLPSHKVLFGKATELPRYRKLHQEWRTSTTDFNGWVT